MIKVEKLWCSLPPDRALEAYEDCERGIPTRCINTNAVKLMAKQTGRRVRKVNTLKGFVNWSERVDGVWHMFRMPLKPGYAKKIDKYDNERAHFKLPRVAPFGPVEYKGPCSERHDPLDIIRARKSRYAERVEAGDITPRSKFRQAQLPHVLLRGG